MGRLVIVEEALGDMQELVLADVPGADLSQWRLEVGLLRLIRTDSSAVMIRSNTTPRRRLLAVNDARFTFDTMMGRYLCLRRRRAVVELAKAGQSPTDAPNAAASAWSTFPPTVEPMQRSVSARTSG